MAKEEEVPRSISRREFVKGAAVGAAGAAAVGALASCAPAPVPTTAPGETAAPAPTCPPAAECLLPGIPETWDKEADVVIVGLGGAGATAAVEACRAGAKVIVLEKMKEGEEGGNTVSTTAGTWCPGNYENAVKYIKFLQQGTTPDDLIEAEVKEMMKNYDWLAGLTGGEIIELAESTAEWPGAPGDPEMLSASASHPGDSGSMFKLIEANAIELGAEVLFSTPGKKLIQNPETKEILGVWAESEGTDIAVKAKRGVILSCGGFEFNREMKNSYIGPFPCYGAGSPANTGDGILMAMEVGADLKNMRNVKGFRPALHYGDEQQGFDHIGNGLCREGGWCIFVNRYGYRFVEEGEHWRHGHRINSQFLFFNGRQGDRPYEYTNVPMYAIFDEAKRLYKKLGDPDGWVHNKIGYDWSDDNQTLIDDGYIIKADTIAELATMINDKWPAAHGAMDPAVLEETVRKFDQYCAAGKDLEFGRGDPPGGKPEWLVPKGDPPYYAMELAPGMSCTEGGPKRNTKSQVLNRNNEPIPRLYSAGEMGSMTGFMYQGASNVGDALVSGRWAGQNAAAETPWE